jgi:sugar (pentulose or hexulose) kinase
LTAKAVVLAGGATRDPRWNRLRAEILQRPVLVMGDMECTLRGVALLAWAALGALDLKAPPAEWFSGEEMLPDSSHEAFCTGLMDRFRLVPGRAVR